MPPVNCPSPLPVRPLIPSLLGNLGLSASAGEGGEERATGKQTNGSLRLGWGGACAAMEKREAVLWGRRGRWEEDLEIEGKGESKQRGQEGK